ncbi:hypothetical protein [Anaerotruncus colihominis]|nr:hypothetical protein [Anaerotruncus colihominis]
MKNRRESGVHPGAESAGHKRPHHAARERRTFARAVRSAGSEY